MEIGAVSSDTTNLNAGAVAASGTPDYSYQPHGPSDADTHVASMSFDDFLDMVNPLQHIPLVSSIYRAVTGETINPVSRIAGDAMYGGILGLASAGLSALGAAADEVVAELNGGQSASSYIVASLFGSGDDKTADTQLATAGTSTSTQGTATPATTTTTDMQMAGLLQTPARQSPILAMPDLSNAPTQMAAAPQAPVQTAQAATTPTDAADAPAPSGAPGLPIDRSKAAYGGIMSSADMLQNAQQNQSLALAMASSQNNLQAQRSIRNNRFAVATNPQAAAVMNSPLTAPVQSLSIPGSTSATQIEPKTQAAMDNLLHELQSMRNINQYKNAAQSSATTGDKVDLTN